MAGTYSKVKTVSPGDDITASDRNAEHDNHINNADPDGIGDASADNTEMQATADPYPGSSESLATDLRGELQRIRYMIGPSGISGSDVAQWYIDPPITLTTLKAWADYRRPNLEHNSTTTVDVENNTGTSNQTKIIFPDGEIRSVTEDLASTNIYRRFDITATAEFTTGTLDSGLYTGLSETTNTWYAIYAVKVTKAGDTDKFVLVGTTTLPTQGNFATLNSNLGTDGWVYLGLIRNGDNSAATGDILNFEQSGPMTIFRNTMSAQKAGTGTLLSSTGASTSSSWTYAAGTGTAQAPNNITQGLFRVSTATGPTEVRLSDSGGARYMYDVSSSISSALAGWMAITEGVRVETSSSVDLDTALSGFYDGSLAAGINPIL